MKKLFCLLLALILFPAVSFSDPDDEGLFIGKWICTEYYNDGSLQSILIDFREDHTSLVVFCNGNGENEEISGRAFAGTWSFNYDTLHVITGHNTSKDFILTDNGFIAEKYAGGYSVYSPVKVYDTSDATNGPVPLSMLETGVQIPTGTYIIGQDIPAGVYRFDLNKSAASVRYYDKQTDFIADADFKLNTRSQTYSRLSLAEGGKLIIENASIILSYAKSIFE